MVYCKLIIYQITHFLEFQLYAWNITFTKINLVYSLPPCLYEFLAVQKGHGSSPFIHVRGITKMLHRIYMYQFCGVRSQLHVYPEELNAEIIYKNHKMITESEFLLQFQIIDHGLVESYPTGIMKTHINTIYPQKLFVAGTSLTVFIFQLLVEKINMPSMTFTPFKETYVLYSGPIIHEQFRVKNFRRSMIIPSFQCILVVYTNYSSVQGGMEFFAIRQPVVDYIKLKIGKEVLASFPNTKCGHPYGTLCVIEVS